MIKTFSLIFALWTQGADESWILDWGLSEDDCYESQILLEDMATRMGGELVCVEEEG